MSEAINFRGMSSERERSQESNFSSSHHHNQHLRHGLFENDSSSKDFQMRPKFNEKFHQSTVQDVIESVLREVLHGRPYNADEAPKLVNEISQTIIGRVKQLNYPRYKLISSIVLGEQIGAGVHSGMRCLWDADTDTYATFTYKTDAIFCVGTVCGVYYY